MRRYPYHTGLSSSARGNASVMMTRVPMTLARRRDAAGWSETTTTTPTAVKRSSPTTRCHCCCAQPELATTEAVAGMLMSMSTSLSPSYQAPMDLQTLRCPHMYLCLYLYMYPLHSGQGPRETHYSWIARRCHGWSERRCRYSCCRSPPPGRMGTACSSTWWVFPTRSGHQSPCWRSRASWQTPRAGRPCTPSGPWSARWMPSGCGCMPCSSVPSSRCTF